ncbi:hypothetical protein PWT90_02490 [Aphanocladium album]|nr:hypothetical protein PWT90_02490 [Aphanocladium album]
MLSPGRVLIRRAPRLLVTARHNSSNATAAQTASLEQQQELPGFLQNSQGNGQAVAATQAPWRLKELRQQEGHHKQALINKRGLATGPLSYVKHSENIIVSSPESGASITLDAAALRDGCQCATCKDPSSGQKSFASIEIPHGIRIANVREKADGLGVTFHNEIPRFTSSHETTVAWESLELAFGARAPIDMAVIPPVFNSVRARAGITLWDRATIARQVRKIDYAAFMAGGEATWAVVLDLVRLGLVYITDVPRDEDAVVRITTRLANIRETFYGRTFDVRAKPNAENVAYTSGYLGLHQDLLYLDPPPKIQILHCLDNSCAGGESLFSDGERAGRLLLNHPQLAAPLRAHAVPYAYTRNGYNYAQRRPLLHYDRDGRFENVFWSPPFQGGRLADEAGLQPWLRGARVFEKLINGEAAMYQRKTLPGECVLFDNLRVMHGRTAFDAAGGGSRWLRGAYIAQEDFASIATQIPREMMERARADESVWYEGHEEKLAAHDEWAAEAQALVASET